MKEPDDNFRTWTEVHLTRLFSECSPSDPLAPYQACIREWATTYLAAPHPNLGRDGPVCPFTPSSISKELFWVACVDRPDLTAKGIEEVIVGMVTGFCQLAPTAGPDVLLKTILILFPTVADCRMIDEVQRRLKEESVTRGLMLGQFYPGCEEPGIRNSAFRPLRSPVPLLAIRHMVSSDFPFLATKVEWIEDYLKRFAPAIPAPVRSIIAAKFDAQDAAASSQSVSPRR